MNLKKKILALLGSVVLIVGSVSVYCYVEKSVTKIESTEKESHKKTSKDKTSDSSANSSSKKNTTSNSKTSLNKSNNESTNTTENTSEVLENQEIVEPEVTSEPPIEVPLEPQSEPIQEEVVTPEEEYVPEPYYPSSEYVGTYTITAYTWTGSTMANGEYPYVGCVASCDFPLGTTIYIDGVGTFVVNDVCPTSGVIDVYMNTYDECINFGCFQANVSIVY